MTIRRGIAGTGNCVSAGSGDGVRERLNIFDRDGSVKEDRPTRCSVASFPSVGVSVTGGAAQSVIMCADSASNVSPTL